MDDKYEEMQINKKLVPSQQVGDDTDWGKVQGSLL